jgi:hypothetical protein
MANPVLMGKVIGGIAVINAILPAPFSIAQSFDFRKQDIQGKLDVSITIRMHRLWNVLFGYVPLLLSTARHKGKQKQKKNIQRSDHIIAEEAA